MSTRFGPRWMWDWLRRAALAACLAAGLGAIAQPSPVGELTTCVGKFPNPITDTCWSCIWPMSFGGVEFGSGRDIPGDNGKPTCLCPGTPVRKGVTFGYWEPSHAIDVAQPGCLVGLGGIDTGIPGPEHTQNRRGAHGQDGSFYQSHWYTDPLMSLTEMVLDAACVSGTVTDIGYLSEVDPTQREDLAAIFVNPEAALFTALPLQASCGADCLASSVLPNAGQYWCAGCHGPMFPLTGRVPAHVGGLAQASSLVAMRTVAGLQRKGILWTQHTYAAVCGPFPNPAVIDKVSHKTQRTFPVPQTTGTPTCCNWMGETQAITGAGSEFPYGGEQAHYRMFGKRVCCLF